MFVVSFSHLCLSNEVEQTYTHKNFYLLDCLSVGQILKYLITKFKSKNNVLTKNYK